MKKWEVLQSKKVLTNRFYNVRKDKCKTESGSILNEYYVREEKGSATVFAITKDDKVILEEAYRHGINKISWDLPCGAIKDNETPKQAIERELLEETGYKVKEIVELSELAYSPADSEQKLYVFFARLEDEPSKSNPEEGEEFKLKFIPLSQVEKNIENGQIFCTLCVSAIYLALKYINN